MEYIIRAMKANEFPILKEFLYEAIYQRDENNLAPRTIIERPELQVYIKDFGKMKDDYCFCAEVAGRIVGAVWVRNIKGYGNLNDATPEFAISLYKEFRGYGIGTAMMRKMVEYLRNKGYPRASLAVQKDNYAVNMYLNVGFQIIDENEDEYIMIHNLQQ